MCSPLVNLNVRLPRTRIRTRTNTNPNGTEANALSAVDSTVPPLGTMRSEVKTLLLEDKNCDAVVNEKNSDLTARSEERAEPKVDFLGRAFACVPSSSEQVGLFGKRVRHPVATCHNSRKSRASRKNATKLWHTRKCWIPQCQHWRR